MRLRAVGVAIITNGTLIRNARAAIFRCESECPWPAQTRSDPWAKLGEGGDTDAVFGC